MIVLLLSFLLASADIASVYDPQASLPFAYFAQPLSASSMMQLRQYSAYFLETINNHTDEYHLLQWNPYLTDNYSHLINDHMPWEVNSIPSLKAKGFVANNSHLEYIVGINSHSNSIAIVKMS